MMMALSSLKHSFKDSIKHYQDTISRISLKVNNFISANDKEKDASVKERIKNSEEIAIASSGENNQDDVSTRVTKSINKQ